VEVLDTITMDWGFVYIFLLAAVEIYGDFNLRWFALSRQPTYLLQGILGYAGVVYFLVMSLMYGNVLYVNGLWDGMSGIIESIAAYYLLGDRLTNTQQYIGLVMTVAGVALMKLSG
jgi:multidrug transporter EmrE-like cation transporter